MTHTRRDFLKNASVVAAGGLVVGPNLGALTPARATPAVAAGDPTLREIALVAIDAAKAAGADYADVRVGYLREWGAGAANVAMGPSSSRERHGVGVRALVNRTWGFAHVTEFRKDIVANAARFAVRQAKANALGRRGYVELADAPVVVNGHWETPVEIDHDKVDIDTKVNLCLAACDATSRVKGVDMASVSVTGHKEERIFAATNGSVISQVFCWQWIGGYIQGRTPSGKTIITRRLPRLNPAVGGYELVLQADLQNSVPEMAEEAMRLASDDAKTIEPGKYELVVDGWQLAYPLRDTIGAVLELDRVLGYEADAAGTSYLAPPRDVLGATKPFFSPLFHISAHRNLPGPAACGWDDDGVAPAKEPFPLITAGHVVDYFTNRQMAAELGWWYKKQGMPVQSHGCAMVDSASVTPLTRMVNLEMASAKEDVSVEDLVKGVKKGLLITDPVADMYKNDASDQQGSSGQYAGNIVREIRNGKLVGFRRDLAYRFFSKQFWNSIVALGGPSTCKTSGVPSYKGQPAQLGWTGVNCPAAHFKEVTVENTSRDL